MFRIATLFRPAAPAKSSASFLDRLIAMDATYRERSKLSKMDARQLEDTGITQADAMAESAKPVWNVPHHWMR